MTENQQKMYNIVLPEILEIISREGKEYGCTDTERYFFKLDYLVFNLPIWHIAIKDRRQNLAVVGSITVIKKEYVTAKGYKKLMIDLQNIIKELE